MDKSVDVAPDLGAAIFNYLAASTNAHAAMYRALPEEAVRAMAREEMRRMREWESGR